MSDADTTDQSQHPSELVVANTEDFAMVPTDHDRSVSLCSRSSTRTVGRSVSRSSGVRPEPVSVTSSGGVSVTYRSSHSESFHSYSRSHSTANGPFRLALCDAVLKAVLTETGADRGTIDPDIPLSVASGSFDGPDRRIELVFRVKVPASSITGLLKQHARAIYRQLLMNGKCD